MTKSLAQMQKIYLGQGGHLVALLDTMAQMQKAHIWATETRASFVLALLWPRWPR